jgi:hypothetical protein
MKNKDTLMWIIGIIVVLVVAALIIWGSTSSDKPSDEVLQDIVTTTPAMVSSVDIRMMESFPVQVAADISGTVSDGCSEIGTASIELEEGVFTVDLPQLRPEDAICTQAEEEFTHTVALPVENLPKGVYTVVVNDVTTEFELFVDNTVSFESEK